MPANLAFERSPSMARAYLRALTQRRRAGEIRPEQVPALTATLAPRPLEEAALRAYREVCGLRTPVPIAWPQLLVTPVHIQLMTDPRFPLPAMGMVHPRCTLAQHRALAVGESLGLEAGISEVREVRNGLTFDLVTTARVGDEIVWESRAATFARTRRSTGGTGEAEELGAWEREVPFDVPADAGRRYARVSGDANPVHLHPLTARLFGYRRPIAHGWWLLARCVALLGVEETTRAVDLELRRPVFLPSRLRLASRAEPDGATSFAVLDDADKPRLSGRVGP